MSALWLEPWPTHYPLDYGDLKSSLCELFISYQEPIKPRTTIPNICMCNNKFDFKNQRLKPTLLAAPLLASNSVNFAINRALLTV